MTKIRLPFAVLALSVLAMLAGSTTVQAQVPPPVATLCSHVAVRDDSAVMDLDYNRVCSAAEPFNAIGVQTYIYLADDIGRTEDDWFARLDQIESDFGIRELGSEDSFSKSALSIAAASDTSKPWGHNITLGRQLARTPLDLDHNILISKTHRI